MRDCTATTASTAALALVLKRDAVVALVVYRALAAYKPTASDSSCTT
jgi:hypothetical protein